MERNCSLAPLRERVRVRGSRIMKGIYECYFPGFASSLNVVRFFRLATIRFLLFRPSHYN